ncbi:MAG: ABC transporter permease [Actinomycetota bacterium]|nr:ABC transporter permease [Actinomycetota bacterium]
MSTVEAALAWLRDPANWEGRTGVPYLAYEHLYITVLSVLIASVVALPLAFWLGHRRRGGTLTVAVTNLSRAVPTLALLTIFATTPVGFGNPATIAALAVFAVPPLLANAYVGVRNVDRDAIEAATGMGMSPREVFRRVELPLAVPMVAAGLRTATVQVVATATLAALVGGGGLGTIINLGFGIPDYGQVLAGGLLVAALALVVEVALAGVQWAVTPGRVRPRVRRRTTAGAGQPARAG